MDKNFENIHWITGSSGECSISPNFGMVLNNGESISCDVTIPEILLDHGIVYWLVSGVPLEEIDWENTPYRLLMYYI
jgi:hypothetical protein